MIEYKFNQISWSKTPTWVSYQVWEGELKQETYIDVPSGESMTNEYFERQTLLESADDKQINCSTIEAVRSYFNKYLHDTWPDKEPIPEQQYVQ